MPSAFGHAVERLSEGSDAANEAAALVAEMSLEEKLGCLDGDTPFWPGLADMSAGGYYQHPWPAAVVERLGIPGIQFADGPRGAVVADGTAFPVSMARGALFDPALEERIGDVIGLELRASGATYTGAVCMNLLRHPAWGRAQETYGEDPHHVGRMAAAFTRGLERHVMACMKHFALNSMENARFSVDVSVDDRALHEVYLPHFRHVADQGIASVMSAYNSLNGEWCGDNATLLTTILREEWGWDGFVISDFIFGLRDAPTSVRAGLDIEMPFRQQRAMSLPAALGDGRLDEVDIDRSVERVVSTLLRYARVFADSPDSSVVNSAPHRALAREASAASTVLLRNDGLLPVDASATRSVVVVGELAAKVNLGDGGSSDVKSTTAVTPLQGLIEAFPGVEVRHLTDIDSDDDRSAVAAADVVIAVVGYTKRDEGEFIDNAGTMQLAGELFPPIDHPQLGFPPTESAASDRAESSFESADEDGDVGGMAAGGDRVSLRLRPDDEALIVDLASLSDRVAVAVQCGSAVMMPWADDVSAVLVSWYAGVEGGRGLADVVIGASEPGGRLPFAIPTDVAHLVPFDRDATRAEYGLLHGQWKLDADGNDAQFPFGAGIGYATIRIDRAEMDADSSTVHVTVSNRSGRTGSTVVFAFAGHAKSSVERPPRRLVGFRRVHVRPMETTEVSIELDWRQLDVRRDGGWWTEPGTYAVSIGQNAASFDHVVTVER
jgi:beta-glucosidase